MHDVYTSFIATQAVSEKMDRTFKPRDFDGLAQYGIWDEIGSRESLFAKVRGWWESRGNREVTAPELKRGLATDICESTRCLPQS